MKALGTMLLVLVALVLGLAGLASAALVAGWVGVFFFAIYVGCMLWGVTDWYTARVLRKRSLRRAPALRDEHVTHLEERRA